MSKKKKTIVELLEEALVQEEEQPYEVPKNWKWVKMGSVITLISGRDLSTKLCNSKEKGIPYIMGASNIVDNQLDVERWIETPTVIGVRGDILVSVKGTVGKVIIQELDEVHLSRQIMALRSKDTVLNKFLYLYIQTYVEKLKEAAKGIIPGISRDDILNAPFPLLPLNEQKRIADKVERLLSKIEEAKQLIEEAKETFELRRASIIKNILKEEFLDDKLPTGWRKIQLKNLFNIFGGGTPSKSKDEYWNGKIPWISAKDMKTTFISETMDYITEEGLKNSSAKLAKRGSVAMVVRSGILQRTLPVAFLISECTVNQDLKVFDSGDELINKYFMWYVKGNEKSLLHNYSKSGTTVNSIEFEKFKTHEILLPPVDVLKRKIDRVESAIEKEESANEILNMADSIEVLKQSILSKAFRGELGTNDPSEESEINLLKEVLREQVK
ncbi:restriction endonuclease subunit S [Bacillus safensis]|uniref:restriction endonuclease subunit S n=1 Tax=Bacillus safensis TaxID=561879 RepID=UPI003F7CAE2F